MDNLTLKFAVGFLGTARGIPSNADLKTSLGRTNRASVSGTTQQVLNAYTTTITTTGSLLLSLRGGQVNPLGESITGTQAFAGVLGVIIEHDAGSASTTGVQVFNGGTEEFQGPLSVSAQVSLLKGEWAAFGKNATATAWTVNSSAHRIDLVNLATTVCTVNIFVLGNK